MSSGMIVLFQGSRGSGKTLSLVYNSLEFLKNGWKIYRNFSLPYGEYISDDFVLSLTKESNLRDCVILIDEMQIFFDSRSWKDKGNIRFSHFIQQIRKRNIVILGTTQYVDTIEKRIRQHVDILIQPDFNDDLNVCSCVVTDLTSLESSSRIPIFYEYFFDAKPIFSIYDSFELLG
jgi:hypothetical protein